MTRPTPQRLDPLAGVTAQLFVWALTAAAFILAVTLSLIHRAEYHDGPVLVLALAAIAGACLVTIFASSPRRAPFSYTHAGWLHTLCIIAVLLEAAAQWGTNATVRSDWAPIASALLVLVTGCYRPAREILVMGVVDAVVVGAVTVAGQIAYGSELIPLVYAGLTAGLVLGASVGAATFSHVLVQRLVGWREDSREARADLADTLRDEVREQLREERIALVEAEIGPFLRGLLEQGSADAEASERARTLSEALRRELVDEVDGRWLSDLVWRLHDPDDLSSHMDETQHATIEAACAALADRRVTARLSRSGDGIRFTLAWDRVGRGRIGPELQALIRAAFPGALVRPNRRIIAVDFAPKDALREV